ncbi:MAG TPA: DUF11 domain-containing protein [Chloroflexota bacterium]|nr:DUF11 domain-containing protein [Chloroflexota bacterium]
MIDGNRSGPRMGLWAAALCALVAAGLIGLIQPAGQVSAAAGVENFTLVSLASQASPGSRDVAFLWTPGATTYTLVRMTSNASGNAVISVTPTQPFGPTLDFFQDTVPASAGSAACYQLVGVTGSTTSRSDVLCTVFGIANGLVPINARVELDQSTTTMKVTWDSTPGAAGYIVWAVGTDGVQVTTGTTVNVNTNGQLTCVVVITGTATGAVLGVSNLLCGVPGLSSIVVPPTATRTATNTGTPPTSTPTRTNTLAPTNTSTSTSTATGTPPPTSTPTNTSTPTSTATFTPANLSISKIANPNPVNAGGTATYTITITNSGQTAAPGTAVEDALPAGVHFLAAADIDGRGFNCGNFGNTVGCTGGTIPGGTISTPSISRINILVTVDNPCVVVSPVHNTVTLNPSDTPPGPSATNDLVINGCVQATATNTATAPTATSTVTNTPTVTRTPTNTATATATPAVDLHIAKTDQPDPVTNPGGGPNNGEITYTLVVQNSGTAGANNVTVTDILDNGIFFDCANGNNTTGFCNSSDPNDPGNAVTFLSAAGDSNFVCNFNAGVNPPGNVVPPTVTCTGGQIGPNGGATITIVVGTNAACSAIMNVAIVNPTHNVNESDFNNNTAVSQTACGAGANTPTTVPSLTGTSTQTRTPTVTQTPTSTATAIPASGLSFVKTDNPDPVALGQTLTYTLQLANTSGVTINGIGLTDTLPGQVQFVSTDADHGIVCGEVGATFPGTQTVSCGDGSIPSGETATIHIVGLAQFCGPITNTAKLTSPSAANNTATQVTTVSGCNTQTPTPTVTNTLTPTATATGTPTVQLGIVKTQSTNATNPGGAVTYTLTISATGTGTATGVSVDDTVPSQLTIGSIVASNSFSCIVNSTPSPNTVHCTGGSIAAGTNAIISIPTVANACTSGVTNTATIVAPADTTPGDNSSTTPSLAISCGDESIAIGTQLFQTRDTSGGDSTDFVAVTVTTGAGTAVGKGTVTVTFDTGYTVTSVVPSGTALWQNCTGIGTSNVLTCTVSNPSATTATATINVAISAANTSQGDHGWTAVRAVQFGDGTPANNTVNGTVSTIYSYNLVVSINDNLDPVNSASPAPDFAYVVTVTNNSAGGHPSPPGWVVSGGLADRNSNGDPGSGGAPAGGATVFSVTSSRIADSCSGAATRFYQCAMAGLNAGDTVTIVVQVNAPAAQTASSFSADAEARNSIPTGGDGFGPASNGALAGEKNTNGGMITYTNNPPSSIRSDDRDVEFTSVT